MKKIQVAVAGVTGYTGQTLLKLLLKHPFVEITHLYSSRYQSKHISELNKVFLTEAFRLPKLETLEARSLDLVKLDCLFLATPNGFASKLIQELALNSAFLRNKLKLIDLAADFRLQDQVVFQDYYGFSVAEKFLANSVYGLSEFIDPKELQQKKIVANPGCYPTCSLLALLPLLKENLIDLETTCIIDAKSGVTGAGKKALESLIFGEISESFSAYGVNKHRHTPEIKEKAYQFSGKNLKIRFVPHLLPIRQGMLASLYLQPKKELIQTDLEQLVRLTYQKYYKNTPFVSIVNSPPKTSEVLNTNNCLIYPSFERETKTLSVISVIDNLLKGAAGQAIQNFNLCFGLDVKTGIY